MEGSSTWHYGRRDESPSRIRPSQDRCSTSPGLHSSEIPDEHSDGSETFRHRSNLPIIRHSSLSHTLGTADRRASDYLSCDRTLPASSQCCGSPGGLKVSSSPASPRFCPSPVEFEDECTQYRHRSLYDRLSHPMPQLHNTSSFQRSTSFQPPIYRTKSIEELLDKYAPQPNRQSPVSRDRVRDMEVEPCRSGQRHYDAYRNLSCTDTYSSQYVRSREDKRVEIRKSPTNWPNTDELSSHRTCRNRPLAEQYPDPVITSTERTLSEAGAKLATCSFLPETNTSKCESRHRRKSNERRDDYLDETPCRDYSVSNYRDQTEQRLLDSIPTVEERCRFFLADEFDRDLVHGLSFGSQANPRDSSECHSTNTCPNETAMLFSGINSGDEKGRDNVHFHRMFKSRSAINLISPGTRTDASQDSELSNLKDGSKFNSLACGSFDTASDKYKNILRSDSSDIDTYFRNIQKFRGICFGRDSITLSTETSTDPSDFHGMPMRANSGDSADTGHAWQSRDSDYNQEVLLNAKPNVSRMSSSGDSAIDVALPQMHNDCYLPFRSKSLSCLRTSLERNSERIERHTGESPFVYSHDECETIGSKENKKLTDDQALIHGQTDRPVSPRLPLYKAQTPSFTRITHPPCVVVSDHCHNNTGESTPPSSRAYQMPRQTSSQDLPSPTDAAMDHMHNLSLQCIDRPTLERKHSNSSMSDRSESSRSFLSDSSYSVEDDEFEQLTDALDSTTRLSIQVRNCYITLSVCFLPDYPCVPPMQMWKVQV